MSGINKVSEKCGSSIFVKSRIAYAQDLHAVDSIYHEKCSVNFRNGTGIPKDIVPSKKGKKGCQGSEILTDVFLKVAGYLEANDDEKISVEDIVEKMKEYISDDHKHNLSVQSWSSQSPACYTLMRETTAAHPLLTQ